VSCDRGCCRPRFFNRNRQRRNIPLNEEESSDQGIIAFPEKEDLGRKIEDIDVEEAAITPELHRNVPLSTPGAFRASPRTGAMRRAGGGGSVTSMVTSVSSDVAGVPIEAVLVDHSTVEEPRSRHNRLTHDDDEMDIFTAATLPSIKELVSTTRRYIVIALAILCIVMVITVGSAVGFLVDFEKDEQNTLEKEEIQKTFYSHHAIIFGSNITAEESRDNGCFRNELSSTLEIRITCAAPSAQVQVYFRHQQGEHGVVTCSGDIWYQQCTIPYSRISYMSFDCETPEPVRPEQLTAAVQMYKVVHPNNDKNASSICDATQGETSWAFLRFLRICSPGTDNIITVDDCQGDWTNITKVCAKRLGDLENVVVGIDECGEFCPGPSHVLVDHSQCSTGDKPDMNKLDVDSLAPILEEHVTDMVNMFL
jgi:hypothetical protein